MSISNILQQPAGMQCENVLTASRTVHLSLFSQRICFGPVQMARSVARLNRSGIIITSHGVIMPILCITFKYTGFHIVTGRSFHKGTM